MYFSVIIPLHNKERYIQNTVNSVLKQTHQYFEIIIVDDGSTDASLKNAKKIKDPRIEIIESSNNGASAARNLGIQNASYDYIGLLDADDMWKQTFLDTVKILIQKFPGAGAYGTSYETVNENDTVTPRPPVIDAENRQDGIINYFKKSLESPVLSASSTVIPKNVFKTLGGFPLGISKGEDQDMWIRIALNYEVAFSDKICATYFLNAENRVCKTEEEYSKSLISYVENFLFTEKEKGTNTIEFEEMIINKIINKARYYIEQNDSVEARKILLRYKYTKLNKKKWFKTYILTFKSLYALYKRLR